MPKIVFLDTLYPQVFKQLKEVHYDARLQEYYKLHFGTSYYFSKSFKQMGWKAEDIIVNDPWSFSGHESAFISLLRTEPDIIYCQDLSWLTDSDIIHIKSKGIALVAQHSCPWAGDQRVSKFDIVFTSFPHYIERIKNIGARAEFLPIAFGHWVLDYVQPTKRDIDICFIGGVNGSSGHWQKGTELLEAVAKAFPNNFQWWGYSIGNMGSWNNLNKCYRGEAWGIEMYKLLSRSKIVINRHGEVAEGYSNNMRMFEATGMGACLLTEESKNLSDYFDKYVHCLAYRDAEDCIDWIHNVLEDDNTGEYEYKYIAEAGQARTLEDHTYEKRLKQIEPILRDLIK